MDKLLKPAEVAELLQVSVPVARKHMASMPGAISVGAGKREMLRVPEGGVKAWQTRRACELAGRAAPIDARRRRRGMPKDPPQDANFYYDENGKCHIKRR